ncbi:MAG: hypothetical protein ABSH22_08285 [Tepidisphaeraceae bacterium]
MEAADGVKAEAGDSLFTSAAGRLFRRVIHNAAALASGGPLRSIMDNVGNGIR